MDESTARQAAAEQALKAALDALKRIGADTDASVVIRLSKGGAEGLIAAPRVAWDECILIERFLIPREPK